MATPPKPRPKPQPKPPQWPGPKAPPNKPPGRYWALWLLAAAGFITGWALVAYGLWTGVAT